MALLQDLAWNCPAAYVIVRAGAATLMRHAHPTSRYSKLAWHMQLLSNAASCMLPLHASEQASASAWMAHRQRPGRQRRQPCLPLTPDLQGHHQARPAGAVLHPTGCPVQRRRPRLPNQAQQSRGLQVQVHRVRRLAWLGQRPDHPSTFGGMCESWLPRWGLCMCYKTGCAAVLMQCFCRLGKLVTRLHNCGGDHLQPLTEVRC